jgi:hypothetical protein
MSGQQLQLLVAEDNEFNAGCISMMLEVGGVECLRFDLIFLLAARPQAAGNVRFDLERDWVKWRARASRWLCCNVLHGACSNNALTSRVTSRVCRPKTGKSASTCTPFEVVNSTSS